MRCAVCNEDFALRDFPNLLYAVCWACYPKWAGIDGVGWRADGGGWEEVKVTRPSWWRRSALRIHAAIKGFQ